MVRGFASATAAMSKSWPPGSTSSVSIDSVVHCVANTTATSLRFARATAAAEVRPIREGHVCVWQLLLGFAQRADEIDDRPGPAGGLYPGTAFSPGGTPARSPSQKHTPIGVTTNDRDAGRRGRERQNR